MLIGTSLALSTSKTSFSMSKSLGRSEVRKEVGHQGRLGTCWIPVMFFGGGGPLSYMLPIYPKSTSSLAEFGEHIVYNYSSQLLAKKIPEPIDFVLRFGWQAASPEPRLRYLALLCFEIITR